MNTMNTGGEAYCMHRRILLTDLEPSKGEAQDLPPPTEVAPYPVDAPSRIMLSFKEALAMTGLSRNTLYTLIRKQKIPGARKLGGTWRFHRQTLLDWLACK